MSTHAAEKHFEFFCPFLKIVTCSLNFLDLPLTMSFKELKILLANKNENTDAVFCICIEHDSKTRNRNLGFTSHR